jgi:hypothetical protein
MSLNNNEIPCIHDALSPAIQRCCDARNQVLIDNIQYEAPNQPKGFELNLETLAQLIGSAKLGFHAKKAADLAFRNAMPDPSTRQNLRDYIACVLHGMTVGAIRDDEGARLLAGAKIALASHRKSPGISKQKANTQNLPSANAQANAA